MNQRKPNIVRWYSLGLAVLLAVGCLVSATGIALARYQVQFEETIEITPRPLTYFYLGNVVETKVKESEDVEEVTVQTFVPATNNSWQTVNGISTTSFAVSNSQTADKFPKEDQYMQLRMVGSLGLWADGTPMTVTLTLPAEAMPEDSTVELLAEETQVPTETDGEDPESAAQAEAEEQTAAATVTIRAKAISIKEGSPLYNTLGEGWVFVFTDEQGEELVWTLEGGKQSFIPFTIQAAVMNITDTSIIQLQIIGEPDI